MSRLMQKIDDTTCSLFEENYLTRTLGRIAQDPDVALTELVANAWDAGASLVDLTMPSGKASPISTSCSSSSSAVH